MGNPKRVPSSVEHLIKVYAGDSPCAILQTRIAFQLATKRAHWLLSAAVVQVEPAIGAARATKARRLLVWLPFAPQDDRSKHDLVIGGEGGSSSSASFTQDFRHSARHFVQCPRADVIESYVAVEIVNARGEHMTVRRGVVSQNDRKLVSVVEGPELSEGPGDYARRDYFVLDAGAAQREAGFHRRLAQFIGWDLPVVKRYDGSDCMLYVETIFPLFFVEQKVG